ncbi:MAG TPA: nucleotidyl transferase AbiEii/AbiGii toxin family protein [Blastocatellia bacterium]|nr:nucleotidyl transferase AbiEii/AbiGii toxin family protein [Blastocatellia bacterium]
MSEVALPSSIIRALQALEAWLDHERVPNAIIGAVGVSLVAQARTTQDIDGVVWVDSDRWEALMESARQNRFSLRVSDPMAFARISRMLLLEHESSSVKIDLSFGALPFEREMIDRATTVVVGDLSVRVATPEDLIITKAVANRPKDLADVELILNIRQTVDLSRIRYWVREFANVLEMPEIEDNLYRVLVQTGHLPNPSSVPSYKPSVKPTRTIDERFDMKVAHPGAQSVGPSGDPFLGHEIFSAADFASKPGSKRDPKKRRKKKKK